MPESLPITPRVKDYAQRIGTPVRPGMLVGED